MDARAGRVPQNDPPRDRGMGRCSGSSLIHLRFAILRYRDASVNLKMKIVFIC
jgi:hypothetical protein